MFVELDDPPDPEPVVAPEFAFPVPEELLPDELLDELLLAGGVGVD